MPHEAHSHRGIYIQILLAGLIVGALNMVAGVAVNLVASSASSFPLLTDPYAFGSLNSLIALLIVPVALFIIVYFIASGSDIDLPRKFLQVLAALFVGAVLGSSIAFGALSLGLGVQLFGSLASYAGFGISLISFSLEVALIGFAAIVLQHLLSGKLVASLK